MNPRTSNVAGWVIIALMICQFIPLNRVNPPSESENNLQPGVRQVLQKRCGECHSNNTHWPGSAFIAPLSWFVVHEVLLARKTMNFSDYQTATYAGKNLMKNRVHALISSGKIVQHTFIPGFTSPALTKDEQGVLLDWSANTDK